TGSPTRARPDSTPLPAGSPTPPARQLPPGFHPVPGRISDPRPPGFPLLAPVSPTRARARISATVKSMPQILDVEQALLLLELDAPFEQRDVQLARRRMAKRWHPDIAPPSRRHEHQRHLQAVNEAADQLEQLAESSRGGRVSRN